jgi:hypothetical protein
MDTNYYFSGGWSWEVSNVPSIIYLKIPIRQKDLDVKGKSEPLKYPKNKSGKS